MTIAEIQAEIAKTEAMLADPIASKGRKTNLKSYARKLYASYRKKILSA